MVLWLARIARQLSGPEAILVNRYLQRAGRYADARQKAFSDVPRFKAFLDREASRTRPAVLLLDSRGEQLSSEDLARLLGDLQDRGIQQIFFAIGPADGWSAEDRKAADRVISLGRITLPHELAAVIAAEQIYRILTIRAGHPYHCGHALQRPPG